MLEQEKYSSPRIRPLFDVLIYVLILLDLMATAIFDPRSTNADAISYFDLSDAFAAHHWHTLVNAYWHPLYPGLLWAARAALHLGTSKEMLASRVLGFLISLFLLASTAFLAHSVLLYQRSRAVAPTFLGRGAVLPLRTLVLVSVIAAWFIVQYDMRPSLVTPDLLLAAFMLCTFALFFRVAANNRYWEAAALGAAAGLAFLTKSFEFLIFLLMLVLLMAIGRNKSRSLVNALAAFLLFAIVAGPYIAAISHQKGRFTAGDSGSLNYAWYVNGADRYEPAGRMPWKEMDAKGKLKHPGEVLASNPPTYYFNQPIPGTQPQWDDPSYWHDGLKPRLSLPDQLRALKIHLKIFIQYVIMRGQIPLMLLLLVTLGGAFSWRILSAPACRAALAIVLAIYGLYVLVYFEPRHIAMATILVTVLLASAIRSIDGREWILHTAVVGISGILLLYQFQSLLRTYHSSDYTAEVQPFSAVYESDLWAAANSLRADLNLHPGDQVACLGDTACWWNGYWARLAGVKITAYIGDMDSKQSPQSEDVLPQLEGAPGVLGELRQHNVRAIVGYFPHRPPADPGWKPLGEGGWFAFPVNGT